MKADMRKEPDEMKAKQLDAECPMFEAAIEYLRNGLRPVPVHPHEKRLVILRAELSYPPSSDALSRWWTQHPDARVGILTGVDSNLVVVEVDPGYPGTLDELEVPSSVFRVKIPSGGIQLWFRHPGGLVHNRAIRLGVHVRGDGAFIIAPPSPGYLPETQLDYEKLPVAPDWVLEEESTDGWTESLDMFGDLEETNPALRLHAASELEGPELYFTINPLVPASTLTLLVGEHKTGKSLLAMEMIRAVLTGSPFLGHFTAGQGNVIALFLDDPASLVYKRLENIGLRDEGLEVATRQDADPDRPLRLLDTLAKKAATRRPALIILDALYVLFKGKDQLQQPGDMIQRLERIAEDSGSAVVLIHHPSKSNNKAAGSFLIPAIAKSILHLSQPNKREAGRYRDKGTTRRVLRVEGKYVPETSYALDFTGPAGWRLLAETSAVKDEDLVPSLEALVSGNPGLTTGDLARKVGRRGEDVRRALEQLAQKGLAYHHKTRTGRPGRPGGTWWPGRRSE